MSDDRPARRESGTTLLSAVIVCVALTALGAAALGSVPSTLRAISEQTERTAARYQAIGGAAWSARQVERGKSGSISFKGRPPTHGKVTFGAPLTPAQLAAAPDGSFTVTVTALEGSCRLVTSSSKRGRSIVTVCQVLQPAPFSALRQSLAALSGVQLRGAVFSDGYDSDAGSYAAQVAPRPGGYSAGLMTGTILSNGSISLASGTVHGRVARGAVGTLDAGAARIAGSTAPLAATYDAPEITPGSLARPEDPIPDDDAPPPPPAPPPVDASGNPVVMSFGAGGPTRIDGGSYDADTVRVTGTAVHIHGNVVLRARSRLEIGPGGSLVIDKDSSLRIEADGALDIGGGGIVNQTEIKGKKGHGGSNPEPDPTRLSVVAVTDPEAPAPLTRIATAAPFHGALYAPGRALAIEAPLVVFGGVVAGSIDTSSAVTLHYDAALGRVDLKGGPERSYEVAATWSAP